MTDPTPTNQKTASSFREKVAQIGTTRFWAKVGAVLGALGVIGTLWSTFIGRTIPDLLKSHTPPIVEFRASASRICRRLPQENWGTTNGVEEGRHPPLTFDGADQLGRSVSETMLTPFDAVTRQMLTLTAPTAYAQRFQDFANAIVSADQRLLTTTTAVFNVYQGNAAMSDALSSIRLTNAAVTEAHGDASLMDLGSCTDGLAWLMDRLATTGAAITPTGMFNF